MYHSGHEQQRKQSRQPSRQLSQATLPPMSPLDQQPPTPIQQQQPQPQQHPQQLQQPQTLNIESRLPVAAAANVAFPPAGPTLRQRRVARNPALELKIAQMALPLAPLVQLSTGRVHPAFPPTLLHFWLLTDAELEGLAHFYDQRTPSALSRFYPCPVAWSSDLPLEEKRRRLGRFIGLRGCESPAVVVVPPVSVEELIEEARRRAASEDDGDEALRRKFGFYR